MTHLSEQPLHWSEQLAMRPAGMKYGMKRDWPELPDYLQTDEDWEDNDGSSS